MTLIHSEAQALQHLCWDLSGHKEKRMGISGLLSVIKVSYFQQKE